MHAAIYVRPASRYRRKRCNMKRPKRDTGKKQMIGKIGVCEGVSRYLGEKGGDVGRANAWVKSSKPYEGRAERVVHTAKGGCQGGVPWGPSLISSAASRTLTFFPDMIY